MSDPEGEAAARAEIDARVRGLVERGDAAAATQVVVERYGAEIFGYVLSLLKDEDLAQDAFSAACESVLEAVATFRGQSSVRTWFYTIARHAAYREARQQRRRRGDRLSAVEPHLAARVRTATEAFRRTEVRDKIAELRAALSDDERELLLLRTDRGLSWNEIAAVQLGPEGGADDEGRLKLEAARCRKQFERTKDKLRKLAEDAGLLPPKAR
jgi:RNA polymerase sigma-70 factor (ECF subfamily)